MPDHTQHMRTTILVSRRFQLAFVGRLVGLIIVGGFLGGIALYTVAGFVLKTYSTHFQSIAPGVEGKLMLATVVINGLVMVTVSAAVAWLAVATLHRVAGPLVRLKDVVEMVGDGHLDIQPALRRDDELQEFPHALSKMIDQLTDRVQRLEEAVNGIREVTQSLDIEASKKGMISERIDNASAILAEFSTTAKKGPLHRRRTP